jgi:demethoxyubiquinone hydroxylase (CLK1/Coq7/Cat5 family)
LIGGKEGAMAATVAVESVITEHYNDQVWVVEQKLHDFQKVLNNQNLLESKKKYTKSLPNRNIICLTNMYV